jgi:hypothetical protein
LPRMTETLLADHPGPPRTKVGPCNDIMISWAAMEWKSGRKLALEAAF